MLLHRLGIACMLQTDSDLGLIVLPFPYLVFVISRRTTARDDTTFILHLFAALTQHEHGMSV
jgi:hypothetical protein